MPRKKRKQTVADCGSSKDTVFRRVAAFLPLLVPVRQAKEACGEPQVSFWDAITGRVPASPEDIVLSPERDFVVGGQHTGDRNPLRHWVLGEGGVPRRIRESPLGSVFDGHFETLPVGLQVELIEDKAGVHAERWVTESHRVAVGKGSPVLAGNSGKVAAHLDAAIEKVTEGLHSGQFRCLGTIEDWHAEHGSYPLTSGLSIEPEKPRLVTDPLVVNRNTAKQAVELEGLNEVRENVRWDGGGEAPWQVGHDQKSGYNNLLLSEEAQVLFMFAFLGYIFVEMTLPHGWLNAAHCQQRGAVLAMGFMRHLGALGSMYLDDSHLASGLQIEPQAGPPGKLMHWEVRMYGDLRHRLGQQSYALEVLLAYYFGVWLSWERKCNRRPTRRLVVLGMICDTVRQAFIIPDEKRRRHVELGRGLIRTLEGNRVVDFYATGRFAGQTMGFWHAVPRARLYLTPLYSLITDAELVGDVRTCDAMTKSAWWRKVHGTTTRTVRDEWCEPVLEALRDLCGIVGHPDVGHPDEGDAVVYSFVRERHVKVELRVCHDATLSSWGIYADGLGSDGGLLEEGGELPETLCGVQLASRNTGTTEIGAVLLSLLGMVRVAAVLAVLKVHRVWMMMDNLENVLSMNGCKVSGVQRVGKYVIVRAIFKLLDQHGISMSFGHV